MASVRGKVIKLEDSEFGIHDAEIVGLYYCKEKNIYILSYADLSSKGEFCFTALRRVNGKLMRDPFPDCIKLANEFDFILLLQTNLSLILCWLIIMMFYLKK